MGQVISDEQLAKEAGQGRGECFQELVRRHYRAMLFFVTGKLRDLNDAEDIVQEAFLNAYEGIGSFDSKYKFKTWLFTIVHNCMVSHLRKKRRTKALDPAEIPCPRQSHEKAVEDEDHVRLVWDAARDLPTDQFTALWLKYQEQMDTKTIASVMNKSSVSIRVTLHRARRKIADMLPDD